jgi:hypothetical protein
MGLFDMIRERKVRFDSDRRYDRAERDYVKREADHVYREERRRASLAEAKKQARARARREAAEMHMPIGKKAGRLIAPAMSYWNRSKGDFKKKNKEFRFI